MNWDSWVVCNQYYCFDVLMFFLTVVLSGIVGIVLFIKLFKDDNN